MALSPEVEILDTRTEMSVDELAALKTYRFDFDSNRLTSELISGIEATKQFVMLSLRIPRYAHAIYSSDTGNELMTVISDKETTEFYKVVEIERVIREAIEYDARIESVADFETIQEGINFHVSFVVNTIFGALDIQEVLTA